MGKNILVVDDDEDIRSSLKEILELEGYEVSTAANGREALDVLRTSTTTPCMILLDLMMPEMNGWEFNEERKQSSRLASIPITVITATSHAEEASRPIHPLAVLRKPIKLDKLLETVQTCCS